MSLQATVARTVRAPCDLVLSGAAALLNYRSDRLAATYDRDTLEFHVDATEWNSGDGTPDPRMTGKVEGLLVVFPWVFVAAGYVLVDMVLTGTLGVTGSIASMFIGLYVMAGFYVWYQSYDEFKVVSHQASAVADGGQEA